MPDDPLIRNTKPARTALLAGFAGALSQCLAAMLPVATGANGGLWWASVSSSSGSPSYLGIELCRKRRKRCQGQFLVRSNPLQARLVLYAKAPQGRHHSTLKGGTRRSKSSRECARREAEPWLLAVSLSLGELPVRQVVALYRRRMQIELGFRDLKSHRYGQAFEDSLTRKSERIDILLLLHALAVFAAWLAGMAAEADGYQRRLNPFATNRRLYSLVRLGWEALTRRWLTRPVQAMLDALQSLSPEARQNMAVHA